MAADIATTFGDQMPANLHLNWQAAIADAYKVFAVYEFPVNLEGAPKHNIKEVKAKLSTAPLNALTADNLGGFAGSALYTIGSLNDYKHFLPRILELSCQKENWMGLFPQVVARKLVREQWNTWPQDEQKVIEDVFNTAWFLNSTGDPDIFDAAAALCANTILSVDISPLLNNWLPLANGHAAIQLADLVLEISDGIDEGYWEGVSDSNRNLLRNWIAQTAVWQALKQADPLSEDHRWTIGEALKHLIRH